MPMRAWEQSGGRESSLKKPFLLTSKSAFTTGLFYTSSIRLLLRFVNTYAGEAAFLPVARSEGSPAAL